MSKQNILREYWSNKKTLNQNLIIWVVIYFLFVVAQYFGGQAGDLKGYIDATIGVVILILIYYLNFFTCAYFFEKKRILYFIVNSIFFVVFFLFVFNNNKADIYKEHFSPYIIIFRIVIPLIIYFGILLIATLVWSLSNTVKSKKENQIIQLQLENKNLQLQEDAVLLQAQLLGTQIDFLRAQINPHFLFNCLNFFYSETLTVQPVVAEGIITLSQIMRYSFQDFSKSGGLSSLENELEHIRNIIAIHQMRFADSLNIVFEIKGSVAAKQIVPMALITLVENIFKHGNLKDENAAAQILCVIDDQKKAIIFSTSNKKKKGSSINLLASGIGLDNIKKRFSQLYKNDFFLYITDESDFYKTVLQFPFHQKDEWKNAPLPTLKN